MWVPTYKYGYPQALLGTHNKIYIYDIEFLVVPVYFDYRYVQLERLISQQGEILGAYN